MYQPRRNTAFLRVLLPSPMQKMILESESGVGTVCYLVVKSSDKIHNRGELRGAKSSESQ
jgi:hypothetical protein